MKRAVLTTVPVLVTSVTSTTPRPVLTSTRRPALVADTSKARVPSPVSTTISTRSPFTAPSPHTPKHASGQLAYQDIPPHPRQASRDRQALCLSPAIPVANSPRAPRAFPGRHQVLPGRGARGAPVGLP